MNHSVDFTDYYFRGHPRLGEFVAIGKERKNRSYLGCFFEYRRFQDTRLLGFTMGMALRAKLR